MQAWFEKGFRLYRARQWRALWWPYLHVCRLRSGGNKGFRPSRACQWRA